MEMFYNGRKWIVHWSSVSRQLKDIFVTKSSTIFLWSSVLPYLIVIISDIGESPWNLCMTVKVNHADIFHTPAWRRQVSLINGDEAIQRMLTFERKQKATRKKKQAYIIAIEDRIEIEFIMKTGFQCGVHSIHRTWKKIILLWNQ